MDISIYIHKIYTILLSRDLKTKKVRHQHQHPHPQNKTKIFGIKSEILLKYKRIKCTPSRKASHLLPGGKIISVPTTKILIKYKRIKWTPSRKASHLLPGGK